jgi:hypothetical protein
VISKAPVAVRLTTPFASKESNPAESTVIPPVPPLMSIPPKAVVAFI